VVRRGAGASLPDLRLTAQETRAASYFDGTRSLAHLAQSNAGEMDTILRVALLLRELDAVSFPEVSLRAPPPGPPRSPTPPPAPRPQPAPAAAPRAAPAPAAARKPAAPAAAPAPRQPTPAITPTPLAPPPPRRRRGRPPAGPRSPGPTRHGSPRSRPQRGPLHRDMPPSSASCRPVWTASTRRTISRSSACRRRRTRAA